MWNNTNLCTLLVGMPNGSASVENMWAVPQEVKHRQPDTVAHAYNPSTLGGGGGRIA